MNSNPGATFQAIFYFVVHRLRWLARVPFLPQLFDALLFMWTCLAHRPRVAAMETLEAQLLAHPGVQLRPHGLGGTEFVRAGRELGHFHGNGLVDARLAPGEAARLIALARVRPHHVFPPRSGWISYQLETVLDAPFAVELLLGARGRPTPPFWFGRIPRAAPKELLPLVNVHDRAE